MPPLPAFLIVSYNNFVYLYTQLELYCMQYNNNIYFVYFINLPFSSVYNVYKMVDCEIGTC